jgi:hypothetical protein
MQYVSACIRPTSYTDAPQSAQDMLAASRTDGLVWQLQYATALLL